jgi:hypothetical protein
MNIYVIKSNEIPIYVGTTKHDIDKIPKLYIEKINGIGEYNKDTLTIELLESTDDRARRNYWINIFEDYPLLNKYSGYKITKYDGPFETSNQKYHHSDNGRVKLKQAQERYRQTDKYKEYIKNYRLRKKA